MDDPFEARIRDHDLHLKQILDEYLDEGRHTDAYQCQTTLTYLVIKSNTTFSDREYMHIMGLNVNNKEEFRVYKHIKNAIEYHATEMFSFYKYETLLKLPLTNIKDVCYQIGLQYKEIFFVPTVVKMEENNTGKSVDVIRFISKYNEMWLVTSLLNRKYMELVKEQ